MAVYIVSSRWRYIKFPSVWEGRRYHPSKKCLFTFPAMAKAKSLLPDSYYELLMIINYGMLAKDILKCRVK